MKYKEFYEGYPWGGFSATKDDFEKKSVDDTTDNPKDIAVTGVRVSDFVEEGANTKISREISDTILKKMGYTFNPEEFHKGMNVEMEHQDVTNGNVVTTAKIAAAHLTEKPNYYTLLKKYVEK